MSNWIIDQKLRDWARRKKKKLCVASSLSEQECRKQMHSQAAVTSSCSLWPEGKINITWMWPSVAPPRHLPVLSFPSQFGELLYVCMQTNFAASHPSPPWLRGASLSSTCHPQITPKMCVNHPLYIIGVFCVDRQDVMSTRRRLDGLLTVWLEGNSAICWYVFPVCCSCWLDTQIRSLSGFDDDEYGALTGIQAGTLHANFAFAMS